MASTAAGVAGLEALKLELLLANHLQQPVDMSLLLGLELLVQLAETGGPVVLRRMHSMLGDHLTGAGDGWIVELQVHQDVGPTPARIGRRPVAAREGARRRAFWWWRELSVEAGIDCRGSLQGGGGRPVRGAGRGAWPRESWRVRDGSHCRKKRNANFEKAWRDADRVVRWRGKKARPLGSFANLVTQVSRYQVAGLLLYWAARRTQVVKGCDEGRRIVKSKSKETRTGECFHDVEGDDELRVYR